MLSTRIITAFVLIPLVLGALFLLPPKAWGAVSLVVIVVAATEWANVVGYRQETWWVFVAGTFLITGALLFAAPAGFDRGWPDSIVLAVCGTATAFWLLVVPLWLRYRWRASSATGSIMAGWLVLVGAWMAVVALQAQSSWRVLAAMAIVWIADTAAYFAGRVFGRHKLAPAISPGKTWEGVAGGLLAVALYALVLVFAALDPAPSLIGVTGWVLFAMAVAALSVTGDLFESLLKRHAGVKDSGRILPGHGGILDRIDALLAAMPPLAVGALVLLR